MPSATVKLSSSDARAWTHNQPVWIDQQGEIVRSVTREEQHALSKALERSRKLKQSFRAELPILPLNTTGRRTLARTRGEPPQRLSVAFEITFVGEKRVVTIWNGTSRYATGREVLAARLLADHGECVLHGRNGKCIGVLRDPFIRQREPMVGSRVQWSRNPLDPRKNEAQRTAENEAAYAAGVDRVAPVRRRKRAAIVRTRKPLYSPGQCPNDCRGMRGAQAWKLSDAAIPPTKEEHHPMCAHAATWAATLDQAQTTEVLYDLELSEVKRPAVPDEILEADDNEKRTGMRQVTVAGRVYAVLSPQDAEAAALEARGEEAPLSTDDDEPLEGESLLASSDVNAAVSGGAPHSPSGGSGMTSSEGEREEWPTLDELSPRGALSPSSTVTARDYLARNVDRGIAP